MTYRERFEATLAHKQADRPPMDLNSTDMTGIEGGPRALASLLGLPTARPAAELDEAVLQRLDTDIRDVGCLLTSKRSLKKKISDTQMVDAWGMGHQWNGHHYEIISHPLANATLDDLEKYPWPDPDGIDRAEIGKMRDRAEYLFNHTPYVVCGRHPYYGIFELGCWMCGFDDFLYRMAGEPEFVHRFFEIILNYQKRVNEIYYGAIGRFLHFTTSGDDFGTQTAPFMSRTMFHDLIAPYLKKRIGHIHTFSSARFFHHTCGSVHALIPELIDCGVDILNPVQPGVPNMEPERLKKDFGDKLTFYGGIDTQQLLPKGTPEMVYEETKRVISVLGRNGGYILSAAHTLMEDVPPANVLAMYRAGSG